MLVRTMLIGLCLSLMTIGCGKKEEKTDKKNEASEKTDPPAGEPAATSEKKEPEKKEPEAPKFELAELDLTAAGVAGTIQAPKEARAEDSFGTCEVKVGDGKDFYLQIDVDDSLDWAGVKSFMEKNDVQKLQKFHVDTADVLIAETEFAGKTSFWLDAKVQFGDKVAHCKSGRGAHSYNRAHVDSFLAACKSLKAK